MGSSYAVIRTGGKQYRVTQGSKIKVEKLEGAPGDKISFAEVLMVGAEGEGAAAVIGTPLVGGAKVSGKIIAQSKNEKIIIFKKSRRSGYDKKQGHRQNVTLVEIDSISA